MRIRPLDWRADFDLLNSELVAVSAVTAFVLVAHRNAWHSTTSSRYQRADAVFTARNWAQASAHKRRKRGTYFTVKETPALRFDSLSASVMVVDFHQHNPFGTWAVKASNRDQRKSLRPGETLSSVVTRFGSGGAAWSPRANAHSIIIGVLPLTAETTTAGTRPMRMYRSEVDGGWMIWRWQDNYANPDRSGVNSVVRSFRKQAGDQWPVLREQVEAKRKMLADAPSAG